MSYTIDYGYTRNTTTTKNLAIADDVNESLWARAEVKNQGKLPVGQLTADYVNTTSPSDRVAKLRRFESRNKNIYDSVKDFMDINPIYQSPVKESNKTGSSLMTAIKITDSDGKSVIIPAKCAITLEVGVHEAIGADVCKNLLTDTLATMFPKASVTSNQIARQMAGSFEFLNETT